MTNVNLIQSRINKGFNKAATILGDSYNWYRPNGITNPIVTANSLGTLSAQFASDKALMFTQPALYRNADTWYGFTSNMAGMLPGDYLVGHLGTIFVTDIERFVSLHCVWCNRVVTIGRANDSVAAGAPGGYSGEAIADTQTTVISSWPMSLRVPGNSMKSRNPKMDLPSDSLEQFYLGLLPPSVPVNINWNDVVTDDLGSRYAVNGVEITPMGTRLTLERWPAS